jgi:hypothetical protein
MRRSSRYFAAITSQSASLICELQFHLDLQTAEYVSRRLWPKEARLLAMLKWKHRAC